MSGTEQRMVERGFQNYLNSLNFPTEIYIQSRAFDIDGVINNLDKKVAKASKKFAHITPYANLYRQELKNLPNYTNNARGRKKVVIVHFNNTDLSDVSQLTNYEIKQFALEELYNRCQIVISGLMGIGLRAEVMDKSGIAEVLYSYYHRQYYRLARDIANGKYDSLVVNSSFGTNMSDREKLDSILSEAQNRIKTELVTADCSKEVLAFYNQIYSMLDYCKQDDRSSYIGDLLRNTEEQAEANGYIDSYMDYANNNKDKMSYTNFDDIDDIDDVDGISIRYEEDEFNNQTYSNTQQAQSYNNNNTYGYDNGVHNQSYSYSQSANYGTAEKSENETVLSNNMM